MWVYVIILFAISALLMVCSAVIYKGNTALIHSYHQTRVKDKEAYAKAFGRALALLGVILLLDGLVALLWSVDIAAAVLWIGIIIGVFFIVRVQRKYNGGIF